MQQGGKAKGEGPRTDESGLCEGTPSEYSVRVGSDRQEAHEAAQASWPAIPIDFEVFEAHLDTLGWTESLPPECPSLFLCLACSRGNNAACRELDTRYLKVLRSTLARVVRNPDIVEETLQVVRDRLLTGPRARIASYRGQGPLETWLRVVATRIALDELRARKRALRQESNLAQHYEVTQGDQVSAESAIFRHAHAPAIRRALQSGLHSLEANDRQLLRLALVQGLSIDALAELYKIHRSNAARRVQRSRQRAFRAIQQKLQQELGELSSDEFSSLVSTLYTDLDAGLSSLLAAAMPPETALSETVPTKQDASTGDNRTTHGTETE